jgi:hypothetical protein
MRCKNKRNVLKNKFFVLKLKINNFCGGWWFHLKRSVLLIGKMFSVNENWKKAIRMENLEAAMPFSFYLLLANRVQITITFLIHKKETLHGCCHEEFHVRFPQ